MEDWVLDYLMPTIDNFMKFLKVFFGTQSLTYWLILTSGPFFLWWGIVLSSRGDGVVAPAFISLGASMVAIYWTTVLQKLTTSMPRKEWTCKISACNDNLIAYLLKLNNQSVLVHSVKIYNRELKTTGLQEVYATQDNIRKLEMLLSKRNVAFLVRLTPGQVKRVCAYLKSIGQATDIMVQQYGRPLVNREFNRDFADLRSSLDEALDILGLSDKKSLPPTVITEERIGIFRHDGSYSKDSIKRHAKIHVRSAHKKLIRADPKTFWHTVILIQYLRNLIAFTNTYGYSNNAAISIIKSVLAKLKDSIKHPTKSKFL